MGAESDSLWLNSLNEKNNWKNKYTYESLKWIYDTLGYTTAANPFETDKRLPKDFYKENNKNLNFPQASAETHSSIPLKCNGLMVTY